MKKLYFLLLIALTFTAGAQSNYEYLRIGDVRYTWSTTPGSLDTVMFEVKPKGLYAEVGMYFDISTRGTSFVSGDSLEIQMLFQLPEEAEVTDMWLWVNDSAIKAYILDKWTASQIYEDIVSRRTDPAILYKYHYNYYNWYTNSSSSTELYMFRIFPLMTNLPRKAKITYLVPVSNLNSKNPQISLPLNILNLSNQPLQKVFIKYFPGTGMGAPKLAENPSLNFTTGTDPVEGAYFMADVPGTGTIPGLTLSFDNPNPKPFFIGEYNDVSNSENYYQMQVTPNDLFNIKQPKKALFLFDYLDANCNGFNGTQVLNGLKNKLLNTFEPGDSFNIMISGMITQYVNTKWIPADSAGIVNAFSSISAGDFNSYTNLPTLMIDGVTFIKNNGNDGKIILISSSNSHGDYVQANALINDILNEMDSVKIPVFIIDMDDYNNYSEHHYIGSQTYYGNEYLYINLGMLTGGDYLSLQDVQYDQMLNTTTGKLSGFFSSFNMYVTLESGFTYSNYVIKNSLNLTYFDQPFQQTGKFTGTGRFRLIASAQAPDGQLYFKDTLIDGANIFFPGKPTKQLWAGQYMRDLYTYTQTNAVITQIVNISKSTRVLSDYTAFLALEPGVGPVIDETDDGNGGYVGIEENTGVSSVSLSCFPNPFSDKTTIKFNLTEKQHVVIEIYDLFGRKVASLTDQDFEAGEHSTELSAQNLTPGTYICRMTLGSGEIKTSKLMVMK